MKKRSKGFTLIELLVVVSIIAMLASIILAALRTARDKAGDAAVAEQMTQLRNIAGLYFPDGTGFSTAQLTTVSCTTLIAHSPTAVPLFDNTNFTNELRAAIQSSGGSYTNMNPARCTVDTNYWLIALPLKTDNTKSYCVSSLGQSKAETITNGDAAYAIFGAGCP